MFSFHSHSGQFCKHAKGSLEDVVLSAIERNFTTYGLSEHMPRYKPEQLYPEEAHLTIQDLESTFDQYLLEAARLQEKFKPHIRLLIGFETEYFGPSSIQHVLNLRQPYRQISARSHAVLSQRAAAVWRGELRADDTNKEQKQEQDKEQDKDQDQDQDALVALPPVQYIVGSVHHVKGVPIDFSEELYLKALEQVGEGSWEKLFQVYFDEQYAMLKGLEPEVVAHFDLVRIFFGSIKGQYGQGVLTEELWTLVRRNVDLVIAYGGLFELNSRAWKKGLKDAYPQRDILEYIISKGGRLTLSDDSHGPDDVGMFYNPRLKQYLEEMKIEHVFYLAPIDNDRDDRYITYSSGATWSFQHVHVRSKPISELKYYEA